MSSVGKEHKDRVQLLSLQERFLRRFLPLVQCRSGCHCIRRGCSIFCYRAVHFFLPPAASAPAASITPIRYELQHKGLACLQQGSCPYPLARGPLNPATVLLRQIEDFTTFGIIWFYLVPHMMVTFIIFARISFPLINYGAYVWGVGC